MSLEFGSEYFPPTSLQISNIHAGTGANNIIPGTLDLLFNFRFSTESSPEQLAARVHGVLDRYGLEYELEWSVSGEPFVTSRGILVDALTSAIASVTALTPALSTSGGTSDGRFLASISSEVVEFGPLNESIHKIDERISLSDIGPLSTIYERTLVTLLGA